MTDGYSKLEDDAEYRKKVAEQMETGFEIPPVVQIVQNQEKEQVRIAA